MSCRARKQHASSSTSFKLVEQAQTELPAGQVSYIPSESERLRGLAQVKRELVMEIGWRCSDQRMASIDLHATIIESWKREAQRRR